MTRALSEQASDSLQAWFPIRRVFRRHERPALQDSPPIEPVFSMQANVALHELVAMEPARVPAGAATRVSRRIGRSRRGGMHAINARTMPQNAACARVARRAGTLDRATAIRILGPSGERPPFRAGRARPAMLARARGPYLPNAHV